jgi:hypothetical protein
MMPFGEWFDRYYQEIYVPAIREAGFEPVRADELFTTGSVVEQIWDQIVKAKLLLADLTGKNANVFYELGLSHAARKPVVFTSAKNMRSSAYVGLSVSSGTAGSSGRGSLSIARA